MGRQLALQTKRINLSAVSGLESSYLTCTPVTFGDLSKLTSLDAASEAEALGVMRDLLKDHVVGGRISIYEDGVVKEVDANRDDIDGLPMDAINIVFSALTGEDLVDPKEPTKVVMTSPTGTIPATAAPSN
jgi:hypothetical protein